MAQVKFVRSTQENGRFLPFPADAYQFWREHGWIVGEVLRPKTGMTFDELVEACKELIEDHPEIEPQWLDERFLAWCLVRLLEFGMVNVETGG